MKIIKGVTYKDVSLSIYFGFVINITIPLAFAIIGAML